MCESIEEDNASPLFCEIRELERAYCSTDEAQMRNNHMRAEPREEEELKRRESCSITRWQVNVHDYICVHIHYQIHDKQQNSA